MLSDRDDTIWELNYLEGIFFLLNRKRGMEKVVFIPKCERCGSVFKTKQNLVKHLTKKQECQPLLSSKERSECLQYVKDFESIHSTGDIQCSYCNRSFQHKSNMYKHQKICKKRPKETQETETTIQTLVREEVEKIKKEMMETIEQIRLQHAPPVIQQQSNYNNTTNNEYIIKWFEKVADRDKITIEKLLTDIYILILNNS